MFLCVNTFNLWNWFLQIKVRKDYKTYVFNVPCSLIDKVKVSSHLSKQINGRILFWHLLCANIQKIVSVLSLHFTGVFIHAGWVKMDFVCGYKATFYKVIVVHDNPKTLQGITHFQRRHFDMLLQEITCLNNKINEGWIPFSCFGFTVLVLCMLAH